MYLGTIETSTINNNSIKTFVHKNELKLKKNNREEKGGKATGQTRKTPQ